MPALNLGSHKTFSLSLPGLARPARRLLLGVSACSALGLMLAMAQVCRESVESGDRWRAEQRELQQLRASATFTGR